MSSKTRTVDILKDCKTLVIKIGTALVTQSDGSGVHQDWLDALAADVKALRDSGMQIVIVTSGAVALGRKAMQIDMNTPPASIPLEKKQAASAVGQYHLFHAYHQSFAHQGLELAQVLITMSETENWRMHLNARATLSALMGQGIIPVINENDTISTGEIRFGDNDRLASRVAQMIDADAVLLLSTTDGLYTDHPGHNPDAAHIAVVEKITAEHVKMAGDAVPGLSTGGMKSKVEAAQAATSTGIHLIIAEGLEKHALRDVSQHFETRTTLFMAQKSTKTAKKRWMSAHLRPKGAYILDKGASRALKSGKSLLPVGVTAVEGHFERGDVVEIKHSSGQRLGMGLSAYSSDDAQKIIGKGSDEIPAILGYAGRSALVHRNDMVLQD